jgi:TonB family protein
MTIARAILIVITFGLSFNIVTAQVDDRWMHVQSNDGEFSIEVPKSHRFFCNADGFQISKNDSDISLKDMCMMNAVIDGTLVSFEIYEAGKAAMDALYDHDAFAKDGRKVSEIKTGEIKIKQIVNSTDKYYSIRQFFKTKRHVCILTAANRNGDVRAIRRFLDSLVIADNVSPNSNVAKFSELKVTDIGIEFDDDADDKPSTQKVPKPLPDPDIKPFVIVRAARASYVDSARDQRVAGNVRLKLKLAEDGFIPTITVRRSLPQGLLRQAIFAALRVKFLPKEKNGIPISTNVTMEYGFNIY